MTNDVVFEFRCDGKVIRMNRCPEGYSVTQRPADAVDAAEPYVIATCADFADAANVFGDHAMEACKAKEREVLG